MPRRTLTISWTMSQPPARPAAYHRWSSLPAAAAAIPADVATLETRLGWPSGTFAVLQDAFARRLGRATGWEDATGVEPSPVAAGAQVFKRGVGYRTAGQPFPQAQSSGTYAIDIVEARLTGDQLQPADGLLIVDGNVARLWPEAFAGKSPVVLKLDESSKSLASVATLLEAARAAGPSPTWTIVGGGLLSDVAAFAASLAGARVRFVPTTLLAMADACVGGKTGVNFAPFGKNQLGTFYFPEHVLVSTSWLTSLPERELLAGVAECLKHAFLAGDLTLAQRLAIAARQRDLRVFHEAMADVIDFKAKVVSEDPGEIGRRAILNFGHTLGHALETFSQAHTQGDTTLLHGEAVALGMIFALALSRRLGQLSREAEGSMLAAMQQAGLVPNRATLARRLGVLDLEAPGTFAELQTLMTHDKKNTAFGGSTVQFVLLDAPGRVARDSERDWTTSVFASELVPAWTEFLRVLI